LYNVLIAARGGVVNTAALAAVKATQVRTASMYFFNLKFCFDRLIIVNVTPFCTLHTAA
jgi:hypothetical protein